MPKNHQDEKDEKVAFDLVRASVNLVVASILIAIGTSLKLPLSTTYVTFMVAMGTSLADGAWGRESAVYRITGVLTVIGGWFFTAFSAFLASFLIASLIFFGKLAGDPDSDRSVHLHPAQDPCLSQKKGREEGISSTSELITASYAVAEIL